MPRNSQPIGFVVPRYGAEIVGGAETLARGFAEKLAEHGAEVEVLTTCARDHHTWQNALPAGSATERSVTVRRFAVFRRDIGPFLEVQRRLSEGFRVDVDEELVWAAGSVNSEDLYEFLEREGNRFRALLFLPYLFGTTLLGPHVRPERSVLIPCLHDEPFAYLEVVASLFRTVRGALFNSAPERALARRLFGVSAEAPVVGFGFDPVPSAKGREAALRSRYGIDGDYLLYFGRKEGGKNVPLLIEHFAACAGAGAGLSLVIAGDGSIEASALPKGVVDLPRLSEEDKNAACAGALAVCQPSVNESFSIVLMEAWLQETPALVNGRCAVTRDHVLRANGGLYFDDVAEFAGAVDYLRRHRQERREMGRQGCAYVLEHYGWERVLERFERGLDAVLQG